MLQDLELGLFGMWFLLSLKYIAHLKATVWWRQFASHPWRSRHTAGRGREGCPSCASGISFGSLPFPVLVFAQLVGGHKGICLKRIVEGWTAKWTGADIWVDAILIKVSWSEGPSLIVHWHLFTVPKFVGKNSLSCYRKVLVPVMNDLWNLQGEREEGLRPTCPKILSKSFGHGWIHSRLLQDPLLTQRHSRRCQQCQLDGRLPDWGKCSLQ